MFALFQKKLTVDTSSEEIRRVTSTLEQNKIKYDLRTTRPRGTIGSAIDARTYARANLAFNKGAPEPIFVYTVYVKRKVYDIAREKIYGK